uniref:Transmembrane BAX inhibitor motif-containing protein 4 n=1 Tax=Caligus rogercresseyi TaxID=217165 RepID=C1BNU8_CALRO|nr:Transmembrane BAX inhibitor motif-containing protein 4 [Caligus rogercresseyi]|eukprot:TRINITY_DN1727_c0_g1_i1.p1 TRINITY_DN1727_c0_g1~~TRINITY_DN1727_c0_g1_i1.p1  ORF type:complete len:261 (-),score=44.96 TRINITY_DN1727_c0_g1_i1:224-967(-)
MAATVPLMDDIENGEDVDDTGPSIKDDFAYHNNVAGASKKIRMGFLRKVYGLLAVQLILTTLIAGVCLFTPAVKTAVQQNSWLVIVAFILSIGILIALHVNRHKTPLNLILLAAFTVVEAYTVGVMVSFFDKLVVIQAFFITATVVVGLTLFTFNTKRDFSKWGSALFIGLWVLILGGILNIFIGGTGLDLLMTIGGTILFSGFIVFDTQMIMTKVSPEEYIIATINLYLDIINLFIEILKLVDRGN